MKTRLNYFETAVFDQENKVLQKYENNFVKKNAILSLTFSFNFPHHKASYNKNLFRK